jgi:hypothetical protein
VAAVVVVVGLVIVVRKVPVNVSPHLVGQIGAVQVSTGIQDGNQDALTRGVAPGCWRIYLLQRSLAVVARIIGVARRRR